MQIFLGVGIFSLKKTSVGSGSFSNAKGVPVGEPWGKITSNFKTDK